MQITIDNINKSVVAVPFRKRNKSFHSRKCPFNRKRTRSAKRIKTMINFMHLTKTENEKLLFITITSLQHKTNKLDSSIYADFQRWVKRLPLVYVCVLERQRNTEDIHFHLVVRCPRSFYFDFKKEEIRISRFLSSDTFRVQPHPALFDVSEINDISTLVGYITKYVTKDPKEYCSLFYCRTYSISRNLTKIWKAEADKYVIRFCEGSPQGDRFWEQGIKENLFNRIHFKDFFAVYEFSSEIWNVARSNYVREMLPDI